MAGQQLKEGISPELDALVSELVGAALDMLAEDGSLPVLLVVEDAAGGFASYEFEDDGVEECLEGAREKVAALVRSKGDVQQKLATPLRYGLAYEGAIEDEGGAYLDALLVEFGERGWRNYSLFSLIDGKGTGEGFAWSDPAPAGEIEPLL